MDRLEAMSLLLSVVEAGQPVRRQPQARRAAADGQPQDFRTRSASEYAAPGPVDPQAGSDQLGTAYLAAARRILDEVSEAERAASGEHAAPRGDLVITAPVVFGRLHVLPVIAEFLSQWPEINVRLVLADRNLDLIDDHVDIAVRIGALADSALVATRVGAVRSVVCGSPAYFAAHGVPKKPEDLSALAAVTFDPFSPSQHWIFRDLKSKRELRVAMRSRLAVNTAEAAIDGAAAGLGVTRVLSYQVAQAILDGRIQIVLAEYEPAPSPVSLIHGGPGTDAAQSADGLGFRRAPTAGAAGVEPDALTPALSPRERGSTETLLPGEKVAGGSRPVGWAIHLTTIRRASSRRRSRWMLN